jgi:tetratricopeptide (TPR) repeat protein
VSPRRRILAIVLGVVGVAVAGTAGGFYLRSRRDVTTSSEEAYRFYKLGRENDAKLYEKEATAAYAEALKHDSQFVMATLRLADKISERDPERAKSLVQAAARSRDQITPREELHLRIVEAWIEKHDLKVVEKLYDEYVTRFPGEAEGHRMRGMHLMKVSRPAEAVKEYERLLTINPNDAIAYNYLGYYAFAQGDYAKAEDYFKRYRFLAPDQANPYDSLGELYANTGRYQEAEENLKKALSVKPDFVASVGHLATVEISRGNPLAAAAYFRNAAESDERVVWRMEWRYGAALSLIDAGKADEAEKELDLAKAEAQNASESERANLEKSIALRRAAVHARMSRADQAEAELQAFLARPVTDDNPEKQKDRERNVNFVKGLIASARGKREDAVAALRAGLEKEPIQPGSWYYPSALNLRVLLADNLRGLGRMQDAQSALAPVLALNPKVHPAMTVMARARGEDPPAPYRPGPETTGTN